MIYVWNSFKKLCNYIDLEVAHSQKKLVFVHNIVITNKPNSFILYHQTTEHVFLSLWFSVDSPSHLESFCVHVIY